MNLQYFGLVAPIMSAFLFLFFEKKLLLQQTSWLKIYILSALFAVNTVVLICASYLLLVPLVSALVPLQIFSFSTWDVPVWVSFLTSLLFIDFINYLSHRLYHKIPLLWRLHRLHHSEKNVDALTGMLHHPLEMFTLFLLSISAVVIFDVPTVVLVTYTLLSGIHSAFTHINYRIPDHIDSKLKWLLITPNFHRTHHSLQFNDANSNFGTVFVFWDYLLGTQSGKKGQRFYNTGIPVRQSPAKQNLTQYLLNPIK